MLTLYHSYWSRATRIVALVHELGALDEVTLKHVDIARQVGGGAPDPENPHPDHKVPTLVHDGVVITESAAIALYLTDLFPDAGLGPVVGDADRGPYLTWLVYSASVMEPVYNHQAAEVDHPILQATFRGVAEVEQRLIDTFADGRDFLLGASYTAADLLVQSVYAWLPDLIPDDDKVRAWVDRVNARPSNVWARELDLSYAPKT